MPKQKKRPSLKRRIELAGNYTPPKKKAMALLGYWFCNKSKKFAESFFQESPLLKRILEARQSVEDQSQGTYIAVPLLHHLDGSTIFVDPCTKYLLDKELGNS